MTDKEINARIKMHEREIAALHLQVEAYSRLAANVAWEPIGRNLNYDIDRCLKQLENKRDYLFLLESGCIDDYEELGL